ncbi:MAG: hypothetical protein K9G67_00840 [Bacteroidales bacterium]|nr:hypothetical protein [Bacteroidales bacterium]MCF8351842.1 hypothetical protein [Bacteroidales bacterium]MCF8374878.1 hypothetical protein [Bacteroidales bacterium]MCF8399718.1 hypothetical protein [Bacteroidales bacterium]
MGKRKNNLFWLSYSDLMTSLFFVMLVLFVLVFSIMQHKANKLEDANKKLEVKAAELDKINEIKKSIENLDPTYFKYDSINKRHELIVDVLFRPGNPEIPNNENLRNELYNAGLELSNIVNKTPDFDNKIKYLVIIEGMAARYNMPSLRWRNSDSRFIESTYILSYNRAKSLYEFWQSRGVTFNEDVFEIIIAGSGWFGAGRYTGPEEDKNKRFLIQIIPKVGVINNSGNE